MEEPTERRFCNGGFVKVWNCFDKLSMLLDEYKSELYRYNTLIRNTEYYLKPVHKVYYKGVDGTRIIYEYYGTYWWKKKKKGYKTYLEYIGKDKPEHSLPDPPRNPLAGVRIGRGEDYFIIPASVFLEYSKIFANCRWECLEE